MKRVATALALCGLLLGGCASGGPTEVDVTPVSPDTGARARLSRPEPKRFDGVPTRIGFEPVPLIGGDFPVLMDFAFLPDSDEFLAVNRFGKVGHFRLEREAAVMIDSFQIPAVHTEGECGASSIVLDPDFSSNRLFYIDYCIDNQYSVVKRYAMSTSDFADTLFTASNVIPIGDSKASASENAMGALQFSDGVMWVNVGDRDRPEKAQDTTSDLGKILRLAPAKASNANGYSIVEGNAFFAKPPHSSLFYAYGFRDPWRGVFDARGRYWVADAGANASAVQEINLLTETGQNFGWPLAEGLLCKSSSCVETIPPVRHWDASPDHPFILADPLAKVDSQLRSAWVGIEYLPGSNDRYKGLLTGKMLYGDLYVGFVRGIAIGDDGKVLSDEYLGHVELPVAWRQGSDGYVYVGTMLASYDRSRETEGDRNILAQAEQGQLWRVVPLP